jgi:hypothetical protein
MTIIIKLMMINNSIEIYLYAKVTAQRPITSEDYKEKQK